MLFVALDTALKLIMQSPHDNVVYCTVCIYGFDTKVNVLVVLYLLGALVGLAISPH